MLFSGHGVLHQDEPLVAVEDFRQFAILLLACFFQLFLAHGVHGIIEVFLDMSQFKSLPYDEAAGVCGWWCAGVELVSRQFGGKFTGELAANEGNLV